MSLVILIQNNFRLGEFYVLSLERDALLRLGVLRLRDRSGKAGQCARIDQRRYFAIAVDWECGAFS
jgi:hypothetical protein